MTSVNWSNPVVPGRPGRLRTDFPMDFPWIVSISKILDSAQNESSRRGSKTDHRKTPKTLPLPAKLSRNIASSCAFWRDFSGWVVFSAFFAGLSGMVIKLLQMGLRDPRSCRSMGIYYQYLPHFVAVYWAKGDKAKDHVGILMGDISVYIITIIVVYVCIYIYIHSKEYVYIYI